MNNLNLQDFEDRVGSTFATEVGDGTPIELVLVSATGMSTRDAAPGSDSGRPFSLLFRGPADRPFNQGIKPLAHPDMGRLDIFLVPMQPDADGPLYEAVFA